MITEAITQKLDALRDVAFRCGLRSDPLSLQICNLLQAALDGSKAGMEQAIEQISVMYQTRADEARAKNRAIGVALMRERFQTNALRKELGELLGKASTIATQMVADLEADWPRQLAEAQAKTEVLQAQVAKADDRTREVEILEEAAKICDELQKEIGHVVGLREAAYHIRQRKGDR